VRIFFAALPVDRRTGQISTAEKSAARVGAHLREEAPVKDGKLLRVRRLREEWVTQLADARAHETETLCWHILCQVPVVVLHALLRRVGV
jgi:hypothetical protein